MVDDYGEWCRQRGLADDSVRVRRPVVSGWLDYAGPKWRRADFRMIEQYVFSRSVTLSTKRCHVSYLRNFYKWAMREGLTTSDPTVLVDAPRVAQRLPRPAPEQDIALVLATAGPTMRAMVSLMACGGLRCCEVAGLEWDRVDLADGTVHVIGKGSKERLVPVPTVVVQSLAALDTVDGPMFVDHGGGRLSPGRVSYRVAKSFRRVGSPVTAHQLRHRAATELLRSCGNLRVVQRFLGHSSIATTAIYTQIVDDELAAAARRLTMPAVA